MTSDSGAGFLDALAAVAMAFAPVAMLAVLAVAMELRAPWRSDTRPDGLRWLQSWILMVVGTGVARMILPLTVFTACAYASDAGIGLFNLIEAPFWLAFIVGAMALDLSDYVRHRLEHAFNLIWRIHRVHHSDQHLDASTALRFHPLEALLTASLHVSVALVLGIPAAAALTYVAFALVIDVWQHANLRSPAGARRLEAVFITPRLHRMHHSDAPAKSAVNLGTVLSIWDRMFGTLLLPTAEQSASVRFGLGPQSDMKFDTLGRLLSDPLRNER